MPLTDNSRQDPDDLYAMLFGKTLGDSPHWAWICHDCGEKYGKYSAGISSWHPDTCEWCGEETHVTQSRDYGYPPLP